MEPGRICVKLTGRERGRRCVIVEIIDRNFALVTGPKDVTGVRRRRVNMNHLKPLNLKIDIGRGASDEEVKAALGRAGLNLEKPLEGS
ncbi:MAG: 50S ribosomal protein L14e [Candidatus Bathyarchaeia archaeon]|nr:50S ribosomal protein L14e [Candidatus Bathyarchaeota archaeon]